MSRALTLGSVLHRYLKLVSFWVLIRISCLTDSELNWKQELSLRILVTFQHISKLYFEFNKQSYWWFIFFLLVYVMMFIFNVSYIGGIVLFICERVFFLFKWILMSAYLTNILYYWFCHEGIIYHRYYYSSSYFTRSFVRI